MANTNSNQAAEVDDLKVVEIQKVDRELVTVRMYGRVELTLNPDEARELFRKLNDTFKFIPTM